VAVHNNDVAIECAHGRPITVTAVDIRADESSRATTSSAGDIQHERTIGQSKCALSDIDSSSTRGGPWEFHSCSTHGQVVQQRAIGRMKLACIDQDGTASAFPRRCAAGTLRESVDQLQPLQP